MYTALKTHAHKPKKERPSTTAFVVEEADPIRCTNDRDVAVVCVHDRVVNDFQLEAT
jgi:hypothetical protein